MSLRSYLEQVSALRRQQISRLSRPFSSLEEFVLQYGKEYRSAEMSSDEKTEVLELLARMDTSFLMRECFYNAQRIALHDDRVTYVEGWCLSDHGFPVLHGWNEFNGKVLDMTLRRLDQRAPTVPYSDRIFGEFGTREYLGVRLSRKAIFHRMDKTKTFGTLLDYWEEGYPLVSVSEEELKTFWLVDGGNDVRREEGNPGHRPGVPRGSKEGPREGGLGT